MWYKQGACIVCLDTVHYKEPCRFKQDVLLRIQLMAKKNGKCNNKTYHPQIRNLTITFSEYYLKRSVYEMYFMLNFTHIGCKAPTY